MSFRLKVCFWYKGYYGIAFFSHHYYLYAYENILFPLSVECIPFVECANVCVGVRRVKIFVYAIYKKSGLHVAELFLREESCIIKKLNELCTNVELLQNKNQALAPWPSKQGKKINDKKIARVWQLHSSNQFTIKIQVFILLKNVLDFSNSSSYTRGRTFLK